MRGVKAGLPLGDCLRIIANEAPEPVKSEFQTVVESQTVGIALGEACAKLYERMPLPEANFFGIVVSIQQRAGGNLSEALGNLSRVLRDRKKMKAKIQAMSMEAKASAVIIAALPFAVMILVYISSPSYIELLWTHPTGRLMMACCAAWMMMRRLRHEEDDQLRLLGAWSRKVDTGFRTRSCATTKEPRAVLELLIDKLHDPKMMASVFAAIAAMATVLTLAMPLLARNDLNKRMSAVSVEREKIRQRERERLARGDKVQLRASPKQYMKRIVDQFNLTKWVGQEEAREKLIQAGYRGQAPYVTYLFFRLVSPVVAFVVSMFYLFFILEMDKPPTIKLGMALFAAYCGMQLPWFFLKNKIQKRQLSIRRAFPDALDLLLICVESGMSIEAAFRKVSQEIGSQSIPLAEELTLTTAELSYLQDRKVAYENLAKRTDLEGVRAVCVALQQSERYGTPLGQTLRVMAQENRDMRMSEAEKKAAALPPKLTVPMILFFLPVLFIVILGPAAIRVMAIQ